MPTDRLEIESHLQRMKGRESRSQSIATRFTRAEEKTLLRVASERGMNLREWSREILLAAARGPQLNDATALFAEMQGLRLILINSLEPLLRGEKWSAEQFKEMLRYVRSNKHRVAADLMESYRSGAGE
ncbi:hypothetical protein [Edaphobacter aggregans]|uniref:hypothetical protein n=1 Tax=Edaphobacter aggregans TaxID=570835 RepID=UPI00054DD889|nr:hypothetical protein [Edaphobacter aggregans]